MQPPSTSRFPHTEGSVLIVVMLVCIGLVSLTLILANSMAMAYRGEDNNLAGQQAEQAVEAGVRYAQYLFANVDREGAMPNPDNFQSDWLKVGEATFWYIGVPSSTEAQSEQPVFGLVDEASKLNLNTASSSMLQGLPSITSDLATAIVTWRSATSGSSTSSTSSVVLTANNKFAPFETVEELALLLSGTGSQDLLYGSDPNGNHVLEAMEKNQPQSSSPSASGSNSGLSPFGNGMGPGLTEYLTIFSREPNTLSDGTTQRVNVTKVTGTALSSFLTTNFSSSRSAEIINKLKTSGTINSVLAFYVRGGLTQTEFETIAPQLTAKAGTFVTGLVNANTAPAAVLACIPGIGASLAWVVPILGNSDAIKAGPYLTANTYQISVDVAAVGRNGRGYRRTRFVLDKSTGTPRIVYRRNLTPLGWALGGDIRQELATKKENQ